MDKSPDWRKEIADAHEPCASQDPLARLADFEKFTRSLRMAMMDLDSYSVQGLKGWCGQDTEDWDKAWWTLRCAIDALRRS